VEGVGGGVDAVGECVVVDVAAGAERGFVHGAPEFALGECAEEFEEPASSSGENVPSAWSLSVTVWESARVD